MHYSTATTHRFKYIFKREWVGITAVENIHGTPMLGFFLASMHASKDEANGKHTMKNLHLETA